MEFKKMKTYKKYDSILEFCQKHNKLPYYKSKSLNERQMRGFLVNKWNKLKRFNLNKSAFGLEEYEIAYLDMIEAYRETTIEKLNTVLKFCEKNNSTPRYDATSESEKLIANKMVSIKNFAKRGKLTKEEMEVLDKINSYGKESRLDKLNKILEFCKKNERAPKQHVPDEEEKRMGEFLSTVKMIPDEKLSWEETSVLLAILKYTPPPRQYRRKELFKELLDYVVKNKKAPKNSRFKDKKEQDIGKFYIKLRWLSKKNKLKDDEKNKFTNINSYI